jgi:hypothetical protein
VLSRTRRVQIVDDILAQRIKHLIDAEPYLGYRRVWARLDRREQYFNPIFFNMKSANSPDPSFRSVMARKTCTSSPALMVSSQ